MSRVLVVVVRSREVEEQKRESRELDVLAVGSCVDGWPDSPIRSESRQGPEQRAEGALKADKNKINTKGKRNNSIR